MSAYHTVFGSLDNYEKGHIEIINDKPRNFAFSNIFEVAENSKPYEMVVVAKSRERHRGRASRRRERVVHRLP